MTDCFRKRDDGGGGSSFLANLFHREDADDPGAAATSVKRSGPRGPGLGQLAAGLEIDMLNRNFSRFVGGDALMDPQECARCT